MEFINKIRFGHSEYSILTWIVSIFPLFLVLFITPPFVGYPAMESYMFFLRALLILSVVIGIFAICWMPHLVAKYELRPQIDKCKRNETVWNRVTKDRIILTQFVDKGPYGQNKGVTYREKADIIDDGNFACRLLNGNPAVIMYDLMNTNVDLNKSVARKKMKEEYKVDSGIDAYKKARREGKVLLK